MSDNTATASAHGGSHYSRTRRRVLVYGAALTVLALIQTTLMPRFPLFGITPDLCLLLVLGIAMLDGPESGGAAGLAAGFLESTLGGIGLSALPLLYFAVGYGIGRLSGRALARTFPSFMIYAAVLCFLRPAVTLAAIGLAAQTSGFDLTVIMRGTLIPEFFTNLLFAIPMYPLDRKVNKWVQKKN